MLDLQLAGVRPAHARTPLPGRDGQHDDDHCKQQETGGFQVNSCSYPLRPNITLFENPRVLQLAASPCCMKLPKFLAYSPDPNQECPTFLRMREIPVSFGHDGLRTPPY